MTLVAAGDLIGCVGLLLVGGFNRKTALNGTCMCCGLLAGIFTCLMGEESVQLFLVAGLRAAGVAWGGMLWAYSREFYHTSIRSVSSGVMNSASRVGAALSPVIVTVAFQAGYPTVTGIVLVVYV